MIKRLFHTVLSSLALLSITCSYTHAEPAGAREDNFIYIVEPGDTLSNLADLYTTHPTVWRQLQNINQVKNELALPIGTQLKIPFPLIPVVATEASLIHTQGQVWVNELPISSPQLLKAGDVIRTGPNGFATLELEDQSTISLPYNSQLSIRQLNAFERTHLIDTILDLQKGSVESRVAPDKRGVGRFEIYTPLSVTGVRGTNLRMHTEAQLDKTELLTGKAHFNTSTQKFQNLKAKEGVAIQPDGASQIVPLLPAPQITPAQQGNKGWQTTIQPVPEAEHYLVQITIDPAGAQVVKRYVVPSDETVISLVASGPGEHFAFIRAVDKRGLMGMDASTPFPGQLTLVDSNGFSIFSRYGLPILLNQY